MAAALRLENFCPEPNSSGRTPVRRVRVRCAARFVLWPLIQSNKLEQNAFGCVQGAAAPTGRSGRHWAPRGLGESIAIVQQQIWRAKLREVVRTGRRPGRCSRHVPSHQERRPPSFANVRDIEKRSECRTFVPLPTQTPCAPIVLTSKHATHGNVLEVTCLSPITITQAGNCLPRMTQFIAQIR